MRWLAPLRRIGETMQRVVTTFALAIVYFGVMTPIAVWLRWRGHDPLGQRRRSGQKKADQDKSAVTAWQKTNISLDDQKTNQMY